MTDTDTREPRGWRGESIALSNGRTANHLVASYTASATVHLATDNPVRPWHILACNGMAVSAMPIGRLGDAAPTCKRCVRLLNDATA
jgi:hypothetical protein